VVFKKWQKYYIADNSFPFTYVKKV